MAGDAEWDGKALLETKKSALESEKELKAKRRVRPAVKKKKKKKKLEMLQPEAARQQLPQ